MRSETAVIDPNPKEPNTDQTGIRDFDANVAAGLRNIEGTADSAPGHATTLRIDSVRTGSFPGNPLSLTLQIKNVGTNPAFDLIAYANSGLAETPADDSKARQIIHDLSRNGVANRGSDQTQTIQPGKSFSITLEGPALSSGMLQALKAGRYTVYYTGTILGNVTAVFCLRMSGDLSKAYPCEPDQHTFGLGERYEPGTVNEKRNENPRIDLAPVLDSEGRMELDAREDTKSVSGKRGHETRLEIDRLNLKKMTSMGTAEQMRLIVTMRNAGNVPAYGLYVFGSSGLAAAPRDKHQEGQVVSEISEMMRPRASQARNSNSVRIVPNGGFSFMFMGITLGPDMFEQVQEGKEILYYTGIVLGNAITRFCFYTSGDLSRMHNCTPDSNAFEIDENASPGSQLRSEAVTNKF